ncbi:lysozyme inhibitor LprI family protein [Pseudomonas chlororaphis]|uniref:lysozyme inhibitor LprI family protein n=1 Tax=Pseudomonas chlororaphis TaxID=587753 RepID=UPI0023688E0A|nr:lysozyme inhibitor LprI family protein [Pseudomonas chlororaphis]WDG81383.1 lysozyme inhibitor LprI family protein [Pseudomonas chlororaphis]WDG85564.1 lysozyme inhibitor LprI family protein [Pseudomonas chlororaphis]
MQTLEISGRVVTFLGCLMVLVSPAMADAKCDDSITVNSGIARCSQESLAKIDKILNEQYKALSAELTPVLKADLLSSQKLWIRLRDEQCNDADEASSGQEAPIEKLSCLNQLTSFRVNEIIYLRTGVIGDGFYKAVSVVNKKATSMDYAKAVAYIGGDMNFGAIWSEYAKNNCAMTQKLYGEASDRCLSRMRFQMPIY